MSGIFSRSPYDECCNDQYRLANSKNVNYPMFIESYVNPALADPKTKVCPHLAHTEVCAVCNANANANLTQMPQDFAKRIEVDGALKGIGRPVGLCNDFKFTPCHIDAKNRLPGECEDIVAVNPLLCEREITPTNMKMRF